MIQIKCSCGRLLEVEDRFAGKKGKCPHCQRTFEIPVTASSVPPAGPASSSRNPYKWVLLGGGVFLLAIVIVGVLVFTGVLDLGLGGWGNTLDAKTPDDLGRIVFDCLKKNDKQAFLETLCNPEAYCALLEESEQVNDVPKEQRDRWLSEASGKFKTVYEKWRVEYSDAFDAVYRRSREMSIDWSSAEFQDAAAVHIRQRGKYSRADRINIRFTANGKEYSLALGACGETPLGWRTFAPRLRLSAAQNLYAKRRVSPTPSTVRRPTHARPSRTVIRPTETPKKASLQDFTALYQGLHKAFRTSDETSLLQAISVDDPNMLRDSFRRVLARAKRMGVDFRRARFGPLVHKKNGIEMDISLPDGKYLIVLTNCVRTQQGLKCRSSKILGPAPHYTTLRLKKAHVAGLRSGFWSTCYHPNLRWQVKWKSGNDGLVLRDCETGKDTALTLDGGQRPVMSPDGKWVIYFSKAEGVPKYYLVNLEGERFDLGIEGSSTPSAKWSDDSELVVLEDHKHNLAILNVKTWQLTTITDRRFSYKYREGSYNWLPAHRKLCFHGRYMWQLGFVLDADNLTAIRVACSDSRRTRRRKTSNEPAVKKPLNDIGTWYAYFGTSMVSYDGKWFCGGGSSRSAGRILAIRSDGSKIVQVALTPFVAGGSSNVVLGFSPGATHIAYNRKAPPSGLYIASLDGREHFRLVKSNIYDCEWSPDGAFICLVGAWCYSLRDSSVGFRIPGKDSSWVRWYSRSLPLAQPSGWVLQLGKSGTPDRVIEMRPNGLVVDYSKRGLHVRECTPLKPEERLKPDISQYRVIKTKTKLQQFKISVETKQITPRKIRNQKKREK